MPKRINQDANSQAARKRAQLGAQLTSESTVCPETQGKEGWLRTSPVETTGHTIPREFRRCLSASYIVTWYSQLGEWTPLTLKHPALTYFD